MVTVVVRMPDVVGENVIVKSMKLVPEKGITYGVEAVTEKSPGLPPTSVIEDTLRLAEPIFSMRNVLVWLPPIAVAAKSVLSVPIGVTSPEIMVGLAPTTPRTLISGAGTTPTPVKLMIYGLSPPFGSLFGMLILPLKVPPTVGVKVTVKVRVPDGPFNAPAAYAVVYTNGAVGAGDAAPSVRLTCPRF